MKPSIKKSMMPGLLLGFSILTFVSCQRENEVIIPKPVAEETTDIISQPLASGVPDFGDVVEKTSGLPFPKNATSNQRSTAIAATDFVDFNDELALTIIPDNAQYTFAASPFYIQQVGSAWIHVKENNSGNYKPEFKSDYGHYHLSYQNFVPCLKQNGNFGKPLSGGCATINPVKEPRLVDTHDGSQWIKIYAYDYDSPKRVFDLLRIKVTNGPLQLWYKKANGGWYHWSSLGVGTWNLSAHSTEINEVLIAGSGISSIGFDDLKISVPAF